LLLFRKLDDPEASEDGVAVFNAFEALLDRVVGEHDDLARTKSLHGPALDLSLEGVVIRPLLERLSGKLGVWAPFLDGDDVLSLVTVPPLVDALRVVVGVELPEQTGLARACGADPPLMLKYVERLVWRNEERLEPRTVLEEETGCLFFDACDVSCASLFNCPTRGFSPATALLFLTCWRIPSLVDVPVFFAVFDRLLGGLCSALGEVAPVRKKFFDLGAGALVVEVHVALEMLRA